MIAGLLMYFFQLHSVICIFRFSLSSGEDQMEKLNEMERLLAMAQHEKLSLVGEQVSKLLTFSLPYMTEISVVIRQ